MDKKTGKTHTSHNILARTTSTPTIGLCACVRGAYNQYLRVFTKYYNINIYSVVLILKEKGEGQTESSRTRVTCTIRPPSPYTIITCKHGVSYVCVWCEHQTAADRCPLNGRLINGKQILLLLLYRGVRCKLRRFPLRSSEDAHIVFVLLLKYVYTRRASPQRVPVALGGQFSARAPRKKHLPY